MEQSTSYTGRRRSNSCMSGGRRGEGGGSHKRRTASSVATQQRRHSSTRGEEDEEGEEEEEDEGDENNRGAAAARRSVAFQEALQQQHKCYAKSFVAVTVLSQLYTTCGETGDLYGKIKDTPQRAPPPNASAVSPNGVNMESNAILPTKQSVIVTSGLAR